MSRQFHDVELYEALAAIEHERWAHWQRYLHDVYGLRQGDGSIVLPAETVARLERQIATPYAGLSESQKQSDRDQVNRYWRLLRGTDPPR